jgi:hypothetical protein
MKKYPEKAKKGLISSILGGKIEKKPQNSTISEKIPNQFHGAFAVKSPFRKKRFLRPIS